MDWTYARKRRYPVGEAEVCTAAAGTVVSGQYREAYGSSLTLTGKKHSGLK